MTGESGDARQHGVSPVCWIELIGPRPHAGTMHRNGRAACDPRHSRNTARASCPAPRRGGPHRADLPAGTCAMAVLRPCIAPERAAARWPRDHAETPVSQGELAKTFHNTALYPWLAVLRCRPRAPRPGLTICLVVPASWLVPSLPCPVIRPQSRLIAPRRAARCCFASARSPYRSRRCARCGSTLPLFSRGALASAHRARRSD
jgi:hypothetical protein